MNKENAITHKYWLKTIVSEPPDSFNTWEKIFILDIGIRLINNWSITDAQETKLEQIYVAKTS